MTPKHTRPTWIHIWLDSAKIDTTNFPKSLANQNPHLPSSTSPVPLQSPPRFIQPFQVRPNFLAMMAHQPPHMHSAISRSSYWILTLTTISVNSGIPTLHTTNLMTITTRLWNMGGIMEGNMSVTIL